MISIIILNLSIEIQSNVSNEKFKLLKIVPDMKVSGISIAISEMVVANRSGRTALSMRATGALIKQTVVAD